MLSDCRTKRTTEYLYLSKQSIEYKISSAGRKFIQNCRIHQEVFTLECVTTSPQATITLCILGYIQRTLNSQSKGKNLDNQKKVKNENISWSSALFRYCLLKYVDHPQKDHASQEVGLPDTSLGLSLVNLAPWDI